MIAVIFVERFQFSLVWSRFGNGALCGRVHHDEIRYTTNSWSGPAPQGRSILYISLIFDPLFVLLCYISLILLFSSIFGLYVGAFTSNLKVSPLIYLFETKRYIVEYQSTTLGRVHTFRQTGMMLLNARWERFCTFG